MRSVVISGILADHQIMKPISFKKPTPVERMMEEEEEWDRKGGPRRVSSAPSRRAPKLVEIQDAPNSARVDWNSMKKDFFVTFQPSTGEITPTLRSGSLCPHLLLFSFIFH